ncbi:GTP 3',8-cyclase MoaA [Planctomycetota bacterium]|nr:GTP 3',8-cyclase MoaA [Planctomycetota bacterium]
MKFALPILDTSPTRPNYASGPRSLNSVRLLRISVTDRCNFRCIYCMPSGGLQFMPTKDIMSASDIQSVAAAARSVGIDHFKITGGEPLVRNDVVEIVRKLKKLAPKDISLTTNGVLLQNLAQPLHDAGLDRLTISLDTLNPKRFEEIVGWKGRFQLADVIHGINAAEKAGFTNIKINVVVMAGVNDDEIGKLAGLTFSKPWTIRFIEYMPLGNSQLTQRGLQSANHYTLTNQNIIDEIEAHWGSLLKIDRNLEVGVGPAHVYQIPGAIGRLGFISAMSRPFCETCNRLRLTATGDLRACLFDGGEINILKHLNKPNTYKHIIQAMENCVGLKPDTHAKMGNRAMSQLGG